jgi:hypothetical protein
MFAHQMRNHEGKRPFGRYSIDRKIIVKNLKETGYESVD